ncbi:MAG: AarF/ABC1/UbiB kinase family protein, partial [Synechococcaceae bacterium WBB_32_011]|nr:AarF/ABC1/UbiB kinase family protein [Synechococcaceae bacterium WBB_32_011]
MRILRKKSGDRSIELAAPEAALLRQTLESTAEAYRTNPGELDPMVGNVWYERAGLREAGIRGEDALHWIEGLHEVRLGRERFTQAWLRKLPAVGQAGVWLLPAAEVEAFLATLNDHRLRRAAEFDLGEGDLEVMAQVAAVMQRHPSWGRGRDWVAMAKECQRVLLRELDFRIEAEHAARFRQQFLEDPQIRIPAVVWELSSQRVLCLDYLPGIKITNREQLIAEGIDPTAVAELGATSYLQQLVRFGFFHADPHPGNLAVAADGGLIYYDFGMMGQVSPRLRRRLGAMVRAAALRDATGLVQELQKAGVIEAGIDPGSVRRLVRVMLEEALTPPFSGEILQRISADLYDLVYGQPFRLPVELIFVLRALSTFEGVGRSLDPGFSLVAIAKPYLLPLMTSSGSGPSELFNDLSRQAAQVSTRALGLPKRLDEGLAR